MRWNTNYNIGEVGNWNYGRECSITNLHQREEGDISNAIKMLIDQMSLVHNIYIIYNPELNNLFANYSKIFFLSTQYCSKWNGGEQLKEVLAGLDKHVNSPVIANKIR